MTMISRICHWFDRSRPLVIGFSGGVDSAVVARAAMEAKRSTGDSSFVVTACYATSPTAERIEMAAVKELAGEIGVPLVVLPTDELDDPSFVRNDSDRCYYCKRLRFAAMKDCFATAGAMVVDGSNADDKGDYRPGSRACRELDIRSPLAELGITKEQVRQLARYWELSVAEKPSTPCLATRIAWLLPITPERLRRIDEAEETLIRAGYPVVRVRLDADHLARIELPSVDISRFVANPDRPIIVDRLRKLGFSQISVDLEGFSSGKMNRDLKRV